MLHFAASGEEALDQLSGEIRPELIVILSDVNMPGMDGSLCRARSRRAPRSPGHDGDRLWRRGAPAARPRIWGVGVPLQAGRFDLLKEQLRRLPAGSH
jgi:CheY-like chemotaxis protein